MYAILLLHDCLRATKGAADLTDSQIATISLHFQPNPEPLHVKL